MQTVQSLKNDRRQLFSPRTVDRLQQIVWNQQPVRRVLSPVYEYSDLSPKQSNNPLQPEM